MANVDNEVVEPVTDLRIALSYSNQYTETRLKDNPGAGANAASRVDMTFVASDPQSELIWSPHNGLSLKCADCSSAENQPSLLCEVEKNSVVLSPPQSITPRGSNDDKPTDQGNLIMLQAASNVDSEEDEKAALIRSPESSAGQMLVLGTSHAISFRASDTLEEMNTMEGGFVLHVNQRKEDTSKNDLKELSSSSKIPLATMPETSNSYSGSERRKTTDFLQSGIHDHGTDVQQTRTTSPEKSYIVGATTIAGVGDNASSSPALGLEVALTSEAHAAKQCVALDSPVTHLSFPEAQHRESPLGVEEESKDNMMMDSSTSTPPLEKLESSAENDVHHFVCKDPCTHSEERLQTDKFVPLAASPTNSKIRLCRRKGKEKALSICHVDEKMSKNEDDSHESVESCNKDGFFSTTKKRRGFEQPIFLGSKRAKTKNHESSLSTSFVRQDSSFMNWISNMVKGLNKSHPEEAPSLALTLAHPNHAHTIHEQNTNALNRSHDPGRRNMGFQTRFQSLYCSNPKEQESRMPNGDYRMGGSEVLVLADRTCAISTSFPSHGENDKFCSQLFQSSEKCNQPTSRNAGSPHVNLKISSVIAATPPRISKRNTSEIRIQTNIKCSKVKNESSTPCTSSGKSKTDSAVNNSHPHVERIEINSGIHDSVPRESLWISRFTPKATGRALSLFNCHRNTGGVLHGATDCTRPILRPHSCVDLPVKQKHTGAREYSTEDSLNVASKELQRCFLNTEPSFGFEKIHERGDQESLYQTNTPLSSPKCNSEAMVSLFARRLDALKHIKPPDANYHGTQTLTTCFYCGRNGHGLRDCSEIITTERDDLLRNISLFDGAEEFPCLCIRCFQNDHWAISCPIASLSRQHQSEHCASLGSPLIAGKIQLTVGDDRSGRMQEAKEIPSQFMGLHNLDDRKTSHMDIDLSLNSKGNGFISSDKKISYSKDVQKLTATGSEDVVFKEKQISSLFHLVNKKYSDVPKGMFDAIKKLRLSRMNILKWMNSDTSLSHLGGFYLRLRVGKFEAGPGGARYYVACITGEQRGKTPQGKKSSICVCIGGVKCLVESQYISNQDFLEEELMSWWCATMGSSENIPSEDHLRSKLDERRRLGL